MKDLDFGERVRKQRENIGLSQAELARRLGYSSRSTITMIEKGTRNLTRNKIIDIANALDTTPSFLMGWTDEAEKKEVPFSKEELLSLGFDENKVAKLNEHDYALIFAYIQGLLDNKQ